MLRKLGNTLLELLNRLLVFLLSQKAVSNTVDIRGGLPFPIVAQTTSTARAWAADAFGGMLGAFLFLSCIR